MERSNKNRCIYWSSKSVPSKERFCILKLLKTNLIKASLVGFNRTSCKIVFRSVAGLPFVYFFSSSFFFSTFGQWLASSDYKICYRSEGKSSEYPTSLNILLCCSVSRYLSKRPNDTDCYYCLMLEWSSSQGGEEE